MNKILMESYNIQGQDPNIILWSFVGLLEKDVLKWILFHVWSGSSKDVYLVNDAHGELVSYIQKSCIVLIDN